MNIGFYFECSKKSGGVYQYALNMLDAFRELRSDKIKIFNLSPDFPYDSYKISNWQIIDQYTKKSDNPSKTPARAPLRRKLNLFAISMLREMGLFGLERWLARQKAKQRAGIFENHELDILFFHGPSELCLYTEIPSVIVIQDIQHLLNPQFPEISKFGQVEDRERIYKKITKKAYRVFVDSAIGKKDLIKYYLIEPDKIIVIPPLPPRYLEENISENQLAAVEKKYQLPEKFLFYPAQFWPHKNHRNLIEALNILKKKGMIIPLVLAGSKLGIWGEYEKVARLIDTYDMKEQVRILDYVPVEDMAPIYAKASGLVMPTFFGWTNIPVVEAWYMNCPVLYSDIHGCKEQAGDAALLFNPADIVDMASKIELFMSDNTLRKKLVENGQKRIKAWTRIDLNATIRKVAKFIQ